MLKVQQVRQSQGKTQCWLAQHARIPKGTLSKIERGKGDPRLSQLLRIARVLHVSLCTLVEAEPIQQEGIVS